MNGKTVSIRVVIFVLVVIGVCLKAQPQAQNPLYQNTSEKFNERGFMKSSSSFMDGAETIGDYDGNLSLLFSSKVTLPNNMGTALTLCLNTNVEHKVFVANNNYNQDGYSINAPEWIIGAYGFALQVLNFEGNYFSRKANSDINTNNYYDLLGDEVPYLIPGYHFTDRKSPISALGQAEYDYIDLLTADGGKIHLINKTSYTRTGIYVESGYSTHTYAYVDYMPGPNSLRGMWLKKGDGLTYYFEEEFAKFHDRIENPENESKAMYLKQITSGYGDTLWFNYTTLIFSDSTHPHCGRKFFSHANFNIPLGQYYFDDFRPNSPTTKNQAFDLEFTIMPVGYGYGLHNIQISNVWNAESYRIYLKNYSAKGYFSAQMAGTLNSSQIASVYKISDPLCRITELSYQPFIKNFGTVPYSSQDFSFSQKSYLPLSIKYYNGRKSVFEYVPSSLGLSRYYFEYPSADPHVYSNMSNLSCLQSTYRDDHANFILRKRTVSELNKGVDSIKFNEYYIYTWARDGAVDYTNHKITGITSEITLASGGSSLRTTKKYMKKAPRYWSFALGATEPYNLKCYEEIVEDGRTKKRTLTEYTDQTFWPSKQIITSCDEIDQTVITDTVRYEYDAPMYLPQMFLKNSVKEIHSNKLTTETKFTSIIQQSLNMSNDPYFPYFAELPIEKKVYNGTQVKEHQKTEYFLSGDKTGKVSSVISFPDSRPVITNFDYFTAQEKRFLRGLCKLETCSNGVIKKYSYPDIWIDQEAKYSLSDSVVTKVLRTDGSLIQEWKRKWYYQDVPFKTTVLYNNSQDSIVTYQAANKSGEPEFNVDQSGYYSSCTYDEIKRIKNINLPGSFLQSWTVDTTIMHKTEVSATVRNFSRNELGGIMNLYSLQAFSNPTPSDPGTGGTDAVYQNGDAETGDPGGNGGENKTEKDDGYGVDTYRPEIRYYSYLKEPIPTGTAISVENGTLTFKTSWKSTEESGPYSIRVVPIPAGLTDTSVIRGDISSFEFEFHDSTSYTFNIDSILIQCKNAHANLAGFLFIPLRPSGQDKTPEYRFDCDSVPVISYSLSYYNQENNSFTRSSVTYNYNDAANKVDVRKRRFHTASSAEALYSSVETNSSGKPITLSVKKSSGLTEIKAKTKYNYLDLDIESSDALDRKVFKKYDYFTRPVEVRFDADLPAADNQKIQYRIEDSPEFGNCEVTKTVDEENNETLTYTNPRGLKVAETRNGGGLSLTTLFEYDSLDRLSQVTSPENRITSYYYDNIGNLNKRVSPDDGENLFFTDKYGCQRFSVHNQPAGPWKLVFNGYDQLKRPVYKGIYSASTNFFSSLNPDTVYSSAIGGVPAFENPATLNSSLLIANQYDKTSSTGVFSGITALMWNRIPERRRNYKGALAATAFRDKTTDNWNYKFYGYDELGRVSDLWTKIDGHNWKGVISEYDVTGSMIKQSIVYAGPGGGQEMYFWFTYDDEGRLSSVYSSIHDAITTARQDAIYQYNAAGQVTSVTRPSLTEQGNQELYSYDSRGRVQQIFVDDVFSQQLTYYKNGNVKTNAAVSFTPAGTWDTTYNYTYDGVNRLRKTNVGNDSLETYFYDGDGNITRKWRPGKLMVYNYITGKNRLGNVTYSGGAAPGTYYFNYDDEGNVIYHQRRGIDSIIYDDRDLPLQMNAPGGKVYYKYDDHGNRIYKKQGSLEEYYLLDQSGRELAVYNAYTGTDSLKTVNLYGSGMIGRVNVNYIVTEYEDPETNDIEYYTTRRDNAVYYIKDHLGSIRVAVNNTGFPVFAENTFPFGEISRSYQGSGYGTQKYDFTGKERDAESGLNYFGARYYDSELGRWLSVDPLTDLYTGLSPYNYCGNNPVSNVDPDGRWFDTFLDIGFVAYDIGKLAYDKVTTGKTHSDDWYALGADLACAVVPFATGGGVATRMASKADEAVDIAKTVDKVLSKEKKIQKSSAKSEGIIYERNDKSGKQKPYIGQAKSPERYKARQKEHKRANPEVEYEFNIVDRGKPGKDLDKKEQKHIDARGGPTNKSNPNGGTSNKKNVIKK